MNAASAQRKSRSQKQDSNPKPKKQPKTQKATLESRNFPPRKSRNLKILKISEKNQNQKQPAPNRTKTSRRILLKKVRRVLLHHVPILGIKGTLDYVIDY